MKKNLVLVILLTLVAGIINATPAPEKKDYVGEWKFEVPHAPDNYQHGIFLIGEKEDTLKGEIKFSDGYKIPMRNMVYTEEGLKFDLNVEGYSINIKAILQGLKIKGTAATPEGDLQFEAIKNKKTTD
ncbi:MAG TPA: hypothetical protein VFD91_10370 [Mariniphaga sp.]|nr:hypothetical protein [Mariniphaga sp.]